MKKNLDETTEAIVVEEVNVDSPWYYFYSVGCAFCTKLEPIIDELNEEGHEILKLDLSVPDNRKLATELSKEYQKNCGTPWLINADTGNHICGFRDKDIIIKWLNGEEPPPPPKIQGTMPRVPLMDDSKTKVKHWKKEYNKWLEVNKEVPNLQTAEQILERPRPKSLPPLMPKVASTEKELAKFKQTYQKWVDENKHLPNIQPVDRIIQNIKNQQQNNPNMVVKNLEVKINTLEAKLDKMMKHFGVK